MTRRGTGRWRPFRIGLLLWLTGAILVWPTALSFTDGAGYVGQARLLLETQVRPDAGAIGVWVVGPQGSIPKYPLFLPLLLAPWVAISPALVFVIGFAAAAASRLKNP